MIIFVKTEKTFMYDLFYRTAAAMDWEGLLCKPKIFWNSETIERASRREDRMLHCKKPRPRTRP